MFKYNHTRRQKCLHVFKMFPRDLLLWKVIKLWDQSDVSSFPMGASPSRDTLEDLRGFMTLRNVAFFYSSITSNMLRSKKISC